MLQRSGPGSEGLLYVGELKGRHVHHKMDHLVCFLPGTLLQRWKLTLDHIFLCKEGPCLSSLATGQAARLTGAPVNSISALPQAASCLRCVHAR